MSNKIRTEMELLMQYQDDRQMLIDAIQLHKDTYFNMANEGELKLWAVLDSINDNGK